MKKVKIKVGILGATGTVGQKFVSLLGNHPWFEVVVVAASKKSAGKTYKLAVKDRWTQKTRVPAHIQKLKVFDVNKDIEKISAVCQIVFCALNLEKEETKKLEEAYAKQGVAVISNNSAHRWTSDVPMMIPEINSDHSKLIRLQRKNRRWNKGLIAVKPNCSVQSFVPAIDPLMKFKPVKLIVSTYQAISGAGKNFVTWPEMIDNVIPYIKGEEEKSEQEPLKIWGNVTSNGVSKSKFPKISAQCIRVPVTNGHLVTVEVKFARKVTEKQILTAWKNYKSKIDRLHLPSAPRPFIKYLKDHDRPQTRLDRDFQDGMGITIGRLRKSTLYDWKFVCLSHNLVRGAAGGGILTAELLVKMGYIN